MIAIAGCGHPDCGDDAVGLLVASELERAHLPGVRVRMVGTDGFALFQAWDGCTSCIVVDAMVSGRAPGCVAVLREADWELLRTPPACSTHSLGPIQALRLAVAIGAAPARVIVVGVEGASFEPGGDLSPEVEAGVGMAAQLIREEVSCGGHSRPPAGAVAPRDGGRPPDSGGC